MLITGRSHAPDYSLHPDNICQVLAKPFNQAELSRAVARAMSGAEQE